MASESVYLPDRKKALRSMGDVLVLGLGKSGAAAADYCLDLLGDRVNSVTIAAGAQNERSLDAARQRAARGARVVWGDNGVVGTYDLCIASPGISEFSDFYLSAKKASAEIVSEVEFAWRESAADARWVAITGTNGKTTTTSLIEHILTGAGLRARAVGNIGDTCIGAVAHDAPSVYVAEVSSFQLASTVDFAPNVAVLLNITPDHVTWHKTHANYVAAKMKILANLAQTPGAVAVLDATNDTVRARVRELAAMDPAKRGFSYVPVGTAAGIEGDMRAACGSDNAAFVRASDEMLVVARGGEEFELCRVSDLKIPGAHNVSNALHAAAAALALGVPAADVARGLESFTSLEHRIEACGTGRGIAFYNDSKATNVDATLKAFAAFTPRKPIVLLGGTDKMTDLAELVAQAEVHCRAVVLYGASRDRFAEAFADAALPVYTADHMADALDEAVAHAEAGDIVLLSPACASFDEFNGYEERGRVFKKLVADRYLG